MGPGRQVEFLLTTDPMAGSTCLSDGFRLARCRFN